MNILTKIVGPLLGVLIAAFGAALLIIEMQKEVAHSGHIYLFAGMFGFGCLLIVPSVVADAMRQIIVVVGPYLPEVRIGGRRKTDPEA